MRQSLEMRRLPPGPRHHRSRFPVATLALLVTIALVASACGSTTPSPLATAPPSLPSASASAAPSGSAPSGGASPTPNASDQTAVYEAINRQVEGIRGLDELAPVTPTLVSSAQLADVVRQEVTAETPPSALAASERLYKAMGLLAPTASLSDLVNSLLESQVAGLYVPSSKHLYVLSKAGQAGPVERFYYAHEFDHALQDQHFDLQTFQKGFADDTDGALARQALVEGDAYVAMTLWMQQYMSPGDMISVLAAGLDPKATAALATIPKIVQAQVLFAATQGTQFVLGLQTAGGWAGVDRAWGRPPESTEQILHPDKYASYEAPVAVELPHDLSSLMGSGWSVVTTDTLGEYETQIWLEDAGKVPQGTASVAAAGWGGDRIELLGGPNGTWALAFRSAWDTSGDTTEFTDAAASVVTNLQAAGDSARVVPGGGAQSAWILAASDPTSLARLAGALGLPA